MSKASISLFFLCALASIFFMPVCDAFTLHFAVNEEDEDEEVLPRDDWFKALRFRERIDAVGEPAFVLVLQCSS